MVMAGNNGLAAAAVSDMFWVGLDGYVGERGGVRVWPHSLHEASSAQTVLWLLS